MTDNELARFLVKIDHRTSACWLWTAATNARGYGKLRTSPRLELAHRLAYEHFIAPIPEGLDIDHLCRNPACVNPTHLEAVTTRENVRRGLRGVLRTPALSEQWYRKMRGRPLPHTPDQDAKILAAMRLMTPEWRARAAANARVQSAKLRGRTHSAETLAKMAEARRAYWARKRASVA